MIRNTAWSPLRCWLRFSMVCRGTPYIYQGEELGMTNTDYEIGEYRDIETLHMYEERLEAGYSEEEIMRSIHAKGRDNARTPMQWSGGEGAGFTTGTPWIRINDNYREINAGNGSGRPLVGLPLL